MGRTVDLPWPPKALNPNNRKKHLHATSERKRYKTACWALSKEAKLDYRLTHLDITFHPPDGRRRDLDNMLSAMKYGLDGLANAIGVDDYHWSLSIRRGDKDPEKKGFIRIRLIDEGYKIPLVGTIG